MNPLRIAAIGIGVLSLAQVGLACTNLTAIETKDIRGLLQRYIAANPAHGSRLAPVDAHHGAVGLRTPKEDCFFYPNLRSQDEVPCLAPLVRAYKSLPKTTRQVKTMRGGATVRIAVHQVGTGKHDRLLVCVPGVMADHEEWRFVVGALADDYDFWLIDPPGCGDSDAPSPKALGAGGYGQSAIADRELQAIEACLTGDHPPAHVLLVGHSMGGMAAIRAFADPDLRARHGAALRQIEGMILLAPCDVVWSRPNPSFIERAKLSGAKVGVGYALGIVQERVAQFLAQGFDQSFCLSREEVDHAVHVIADKAHRQAFQAMLLEALPFDPATYQPDLAEMHRLEGWYGNVDVPVRILWGTRDETLPLSMGYNIEKRIARAKLTVVPGWKHAPTLESPEHCARLIREAEVSLRAEAR